ncbi:MAG: Hpt domain-containing protein, partial [Cyanobacteria bacterium P01_D01_bin.44]
MAQDLERQAQLSCLDEIAEYFDTIESVLLELTEAGLDFQQIDASLRAAHTIKGLGAMIGCHPLGGLAHRLEDYLKILKARQHSIQIDSELQTWLLLVSDRMRQIAAFYREDCLVDNAWMVGQVEPVLAELHNRLGELQESDEAALLAQEEKTDIVAIMFESEVEGLLQRLEGVLADPALPCLREELDMISQEFGDLGQMLELDAFVELCGSVHQHLSVASSDGVEAIARQAVKDWRQTQALIMVGKTDNLPRHFDVGASPTVLPTLVETDFSQNESEMTEALPIQQLAGFSAETAETAEAMEAELEEFLNALDLSEQELAELQATALDLEPTEPPALVTDWVDTLEAIAPEDTFPEDIAPEAIAPEDITPEDIAPPLFGETAPIEVLQPDLKANAIPVVTSTPSPPQATQSDRPESMVRV